MAKKSKKKYSVYGAVQFHEKRPTRSRRADESRTSKNVKKLPTKKWYEDPSTSDVLGVDTKKYKAKSAKEVFRHLQAIRYMPDKDIKYTTTKRAILNYRKGSANVLQKAINVRYNNVKISKRKNKENDYWISVLKN